MERQKSVRFHKKQQQQQQQQKKIFICVPKMKVTGLDWHEGVNNDRMWHFCVHSNITCTNTDKPMKTNHLKVK